tara:strand:- start:41253 stop:41618 length:366 start_codon:yes stop_codon:yes gene_type:complete
MKNLISIFFVSLILSSCSLLNYKSTKVTGKVISSNPYSYECVNPFTSSRLNSNYYFVTTIPSYWYTPYHPSIFRLDCKSNRYNIEVIFINPNTGKKENKVIRGFKDYNIGEDITFNFYYKK